MGDCLKENDIVITLSIMTHGSTISSLLTTQQQSLLKDTRLFSFSGSSNDVFCGDMLRNNYSTHLYTLFRQDLQQGSYIIMKDYSHKVKSKYEPFLRLLNSLVDTNVCSIYQNITIDKMFGLEHRPSDSLGIFVVSVHQKEGDDLKLIYPGSIKKDKHEHIMNLMNLNDFKRFADIFRVNLPNDIFSNLSEDIIKVEKSGLWIEYIRMSY